MSDVRDEFIGRVAEGGTFAEVGGLTGTIGEKVSVAHFFGAKGLAMLDASPSDSYWWKAFATRRSALKLPKVQCFSGDVIQIAESSFSQSYDVVHCSGILHHVPEPKRLVAALRTIARRHLVLTTVTMPSRIVNEEGVLEMPASGWLCIPNLSARDKAVARAYWRHVVRKVGAEYLTVDAAGWQTAEIPPWQWVGSAAAVKSMCVNAGFEIVDSSLSWGDQALTLLLAVSQTMAAAA